MFKKEPITYRLGCFLYFSRNSLKISTNHSYLVSFSLVFHYHPNPKSHRFTFSSLSFPSDVPTRDNSPLILPSRRYKILLHFAATLLSWVTIRIVVPSRFRRENSSITSCAAPWFRALPPVFHPANFRIKSLLRCPPTT